MIIIYSIVSSCEVIRSRRGQDAWVISIQSHKLPFQSARCCKSHTSRTHTHKPWYTAARAVRFWVVVRDHQSVLVWTVYRTVQTNAGLLYYSNFVLLFLAAHRKDSAIAHMRAINSAVTLQANSQKKLARNVNICEEQDCHESIDCFFDIFATILKYVALSMKSQSWLTVETKQPLPRRKRLYRSPKSRRISMHGH
jgi:hypothetical protein